MIIKKWLITGGAGFIGSHAVRRYADGAEVLVVDTDLSRVKVFPPGVQYEEYGVGNYERLSKTVKSFRPDCILHLAALSRVSDCEEDPVRAYDVNVAGTFNVLRVVSRYNVPRLVYASTSAVYESRAKLPTSEDSPLRPVNRYGITKLAGERLVNMTNGLGYSCVSLRLFNVFGPGGEGVADRFLSQKLAGEEAGSLNPSNVRRDYVHVDDVIAAISLVAPLQVLREPFNVGSGQAFSVSEVGDMVGLPLLPGDLPPYLEPAATQADTGKLRALGWKPETTLDAYIASALTVKKE